MNAMPNRVWTKEQQAAISAKGGAVLVSAAAGSGKTAVLVERVIQILTDEANPCDADKLLVVTFTKAAAAEMKERINERISELLLIQPDNRNLQRQKIMLAHAHISTIHGFCNDLIKENFYELGISPDFRIADESEMSLLKNEAMQLVLEEFYKNASKQFFALVETFSASRDDQRLISTVLTLYDFIRSHPFPKKWFEDKLCAYRESQSVSKTVFARILMDYAKMAIEYGLELAEDSLSVAQWDEKIRTSYEEPLLCDKALLNGIKNAIINENWNTISATLKSAEFCALKRLTGCIDNALKLKILHNRKKIKDIIGDLTRLFYQDEEQCLADLREIEPIISELFALVEAFVQQIDDLKREKNIVDFGDLEHLTLKLLVRQTNCDFERTEIARNLAEQFDFVMVDEYQDTNEAQDLIFRAVSREEENLFVVGDIKQSIYGFRQAMPKIFLRRKQNCHSFNAENEEYPAKIILDKNFRSREGILAATNFIFSQLMSRIVGEIEYDKEEKLALGAVYEKNSALGVPSDEADVELKIIDMSGVPKEDMNVCEAREIAKTIAKMIGEECKVKDKDEYRPVTYGDFCILLRSANKHAANFVETLKLCGIPAWADTSGSFFEAPEIATMLSLLKVIDNPIQDIPLISALLSPIFGFTADDLSEVRLEEKTLPLYFALKRHSEHGNKLCKTFLDELNSYRNLASTWPSYKLIQHIYDKTGYASVVQAMEDGQVRLNNLRLLLEYARSYETSGYKGLAGFIRFIEKLERQKIEIPAASANSANSNVVKVMSIHRSKGLEFPICFLSNCSRKFNKDFGDILLNPDLGVGIKLLDHQHLRKYTTFQRDAVKLDIDKKNMSEELRVLYVAMTRAREKLIMLTSLKNPEATLSKLSLQILNVSQILPYVVETANSFSDWLLLCALRHPSGQKLRELAGMSSELVIKDDTEWKIEIVAPEGDESIKTADLPILKPEEPVIDEDLLSKINRRLNYVYEYKELAKISPKVTVSYLVSQNNNQAVNFDFDKRPAFLSGVTLTPAQKGSALHGFMQFADFKRARKNLEQEIKCLQECGFITKEQGESLNRAQLAKFLKSTLCSRILASPNVVREYQFTVNISASDVVPGIDEKFAREKVVLQGAIDCVFGEGDTLVVVDYKTDKANSEEFFKKHYGKQLELYANAMEKCTGKTITQRILYSFYIGTEFFL